MIILLFPIFLFLALVIVMYFFSKFSPQIGPPPVQDRKEKFLASPNFSNGKFHNPVPTSLKMSAADFIKIMWQWLMTGRSRLPQQPLPTLPLDREKFNNHKNENTLLCWLGHSTLLMKIHGKVFLIDPVFGKRASMVSFFGPKRFDYTHRIGLEDLPQVDAVIFSHDHYDHLDYTSIPFLKEQVPQFFTPLGAGAYLERWGVGADRITELDWGGAVDFDKNIRLTCVPSRHFSGRGFVHRFTTLWGSWVVEGQSQKIFLGADSGYFDGFKKIQKQFGKFDLTVLECGAYSEYWSSVHMFPEETAQAHLDLNGAALLPIHWAKYDLSVHSWEEPIERLVQAAAIKNITLCTPQIGEIFEVGGQLPQKDWWNFSKKKCNLVSH